MTNKLMFVDTTKSQSQKWGQTGLSVIAIGTGTSHLTDYPRIAVLLGATECRVILKLSIWRAVSIMEPEFLIRPAAESDLPGISVILTHYALKIVMTFATDGPADEYLCKKFRSTTRENRFPFFAAITRSSPQTDTNTDQVIGITYISPWRPERSAYKHTGEMTLFVHHEH